MGEQTQAQTQTNIQTQSYGHHESAATVATATITQSIPKETLLSNVPSDNNSPPSKIPLRPQKIRKLSSGSDNCQIVVIPENPKPSGVSSIQTVTTTSPKTVVKNSKLVQQRALQIPGVIARSLSCEGEVDIALRYLRNADSLLSPLIDVHQPPTFDTFHTPFLALTRSILYQQLAYKAGTSIYTRFVALCGGEAGVVPETILSLTPAQLQQIGVSGRKASYLHDLARKYQNGILSDSTIVNMDDKSLFTMLTMVNGIGSWSVHMFMIFSLHRPDVLPINDLAIRKGVQLLYNLEDLPRPSQMDQLCEKWRPYRSVAAWYLWRFVEAKGTSSSAVAVATVAGLQSHQPEEQHQEQHPQHQQEPQLIDPINSILHLGYYMTNRLDVFMQWDVGLVRGDNDERPKLELMISSSFSLDGNAKESRYCTVGEFLVQNGGRDRAY